MSPKWCVVALLLCSPALTQQAPYRGAIEGTVPPGSATAPPIAAIYSYPKGLPYCADVEYENTLEKATGPIHTVLHGRDCRDSLGRYLRDAEIPMKGNSTELHTFRHTTILDPVEGRVVNLTPTYKFGTVYKAPKLPETTAPVVVPEVKNPEVTVEDLGMKSVAGLLTRGTRMTYPVWVGPRGQERKSFRTVENWYSEELKLAVLRIQTEADGSQYIMRLSNIEHVEPDPALFQIPLDYRIREQDGVSPAPQRPLQNSGTEPGHEPH